jgi:hypothetical protein
MFDDFFDEFFNRLDDSFGIEDSYSNIDTTLNDSLVGIDEDLDTIIELLVAFMGF